ncbi:MAG: signal peptide peptidase SppA [Planctomycetes bacterium]|nr:signal peptide peptidase SppA [Planctomycetota bacterium]
MPSPPPADTGTNSASSGSPQGAAGSAPQTIIIQQPPSDRGRKWAVRLLLLLLVGSLVWNYITYSEYSEYFQTASLPNERFYSGHRAADDKIALIKISGTIMPPFTARIVQSIQRAERDSSVKGAVLAIDSPGGLVADSHQIYHALKELAAKKPVYVSMKRMAASGGYYVAMGCGPEGRIFAEPTTWTGSIGVIIPRYDASALAADIGVKSNPLKTGEFKDAMNPFRSMTEPEERVWGELLDDAFVRFKRVIVENRPGLELKDIAGPGEASQEALVSTREDAGEIANLATGRLFTADQAVQYGLVDAIGFTDDALAELQSALKLKRARVVTYEFPRGVLEMMLGLSEAGGGSAGNEPWRALVDAAVPRAWYHFSSLPGVPSAY